MSRDSLGKMIFVESSFGEKMELAFIPNTRQKSTDLVATESFLCEVLLGAMHPDYIFMDENARPHRAPIVDEFHEGVDIRSRDWPSKSPDLSPIEHIWDYLGNAISQRSPPPGTP
ncbi:DDE_3 domain-containing protein [Trichonephila clavipes]|nr:DDE_3 domain-containing protein [Trichonephila clavipes]